MCCFFFFNDTATTEIYTLSLHDALPISHLHLGQDRAERLLQARPEALRDVGARSGRALLALRSEEHTSELQSRQYLVCRLLLEKKNTRKRMKLPTFSDAIKNSNAKHDHS